MRSRNRAASSMGVICFSHRNGLEPRGLLQRALQLQQPMLQKLFVSMRNRFCHSLFSRSLGSHIGLTCLWYRLDAVCLFRLYLAIFIGSIKTSNRSRPPLLSIL